MFNFAALWHAKHVLSKLHLEICREVVPPNHARKPLKMEAIAIRLAGYSFLSYS